MANIKSAIKRAQLATQRTLKNAAEKSALKTAIKRFDEAVVTADVELANKALNLAFKKLDKAVQNGLIHKNAAARKKSQLAKKINTIAKVG